MYGRFASVFAQCALAVLVATSNARPLKRPNAIPIMDGIEFPDPSVIRASAAEGWYIFSTNAVLDSRLIHVQKAHTPDWKTFNFYPGVDALPQLPAWVDVSNPEVWAPDVSRRDDGTFVMYYTATYKKHPNLHCLGVATAKSLNDTFVDNSKDPWICPTATGGAIDPAGFTDEKHDNKRWVVYKVDGNAIGNGGSCGNTVDPIKPTPIMLQQVGGDGHTLIGNPVQILTNIAADGPYVEAPSLTFMNGKYVLFFSAQCYETPDYDVQYAIADNIRGPYRRAGKLFQSGTDGMTAPGGLDVAINGDHVIWHGYVNVKSHSDADHFGSVSPAGSGAGNGKGSLLHACYNLESKADCRQRHYKKVRAAYVARMTLSNGVITTTLQ